MAQVRSVDFLPEIFQTDANKQFLTATLDQLVQEPKYKKTQGFIGRRVGPGVNPNDSYVIEPTKTRGDYQLEPGIVSLEPDTNKIKDAITYPGLLDSIDYQGGSSQRPDRLFESDYYTWDPFVNWDAFINFSQYFWLPNGPAAVDVAATGIPASDNFVVTRANGSYTFSGLAGDNPTIELLRGGSYTFQVAQNKKETVNYRVTNNNTSSFIIDFENNPTLTLVRGNTYVFTLALTGAYPFFIKTFPSTGLNNIYNQGVTNNGAVEGTITFVVPQNAPDTLYYSSLTETNLKGQLNIVDGTPGTGSKFWIQTDPGIDGRIPTSPNISSRTVLGVTNNGEDLGTITFNVPTKTAQQFYYNLNNIGTVDLVTGLKFNEINNIPVNDFLNTYGGIDGLKELNGRTLVFTNAIDDVELGGWTIKSFFDPLPRDDAFNGTAGSYDFVEYDQEQAVPYNLRFSVWQVTYVTYNGIQYITLNSVREVAELDKFSIDYGNTYANTQWYKNDAGFFRQIPLLTAIKDTLYYQDSSDPEIYGQIRLVEVSQSSTLFIEEILGKKSYTSPNGVQFTNGLKVVFRGDVLPASYADKEYYVSGVGTAIDLLPVANFVTPESYVVDANDSTAVAEPGELDYITISRASLDLNAWTRSNRWFHIDVINATAQYNNTVAVIDNQYRAKRPIIEFRPGLKLFNMGTEGKQPVNVIDFTETDAFSNIEGSTGYSVDGYQFTEGSRVIFAADSDPDVRNKIWVVNFAIPDSVPPLIAQPIIVLTLADDGEVAINQSTVCLDGNTSKGITYWYDGVEWLEAQQKTAIQQAPLYDVFDSNNVSFGNKVVYPSTTFTGTKLFSYAVGDTSIIDPILKFPLQYLNLNNVGDIVFENNLYKDTFLYVRDNVSVSESISSGFVREYATRTDFQRQIGWTNAATLTQIRQQFSFVYDGKALQLDVKAQSDGVVPAVKVYVGGKFRDPLTYNVTTTDNTTLITLDNTYAIGDLVEVAALSPQVSRVGFYQVPINLEKNPLNGNSDSFTLGTIRTHYESICENLTTLVGPVNGANNTRDLGSIGKYGLSILQQSAPLTLAGYFNRSTQFNIFAALQFNAREYQKYKNIMMEEVTRLDINFQSPGQILNEAISNITAGRTETNPFYWSDMLPVGSVFIVNSYPITLITTNVFDTVQFYNYTSANYLGMNVYKNETLLTRGFDYVVATDGPRITVTTDLAVGDVITIQEFTTTAGTFVPNTPTKLGLYPAFRPEITEVKTTSGTATVIVGHDGSQTPIFGDVRDQVLLEFETRIYNNLKLDGNPVPLLMTDVLPGQFRDTGYLYSEISDLLETDFLSYVGWNKLDYTSQNYIANNEFSWNYSGSQSKLDRPDRTNDENLLGAWRGINRYFYDTEDPSRTPWEMLGFSVKPTWWNTVYGPGPYTADNLVLWDDLEAGRVADPASAYIEPQFARPGLSKIIPVDSEGNLLSPFQTVVSGYDTSTFNRSWVAGDGGPVEASWWNSSAYPFAVMRVLALTRPAKFYSLFADRDLYRYNDEFNQYLYNNRYRLDANGIEVYGNGVSKASFIDWIVDYNRLSGLDSTNILTRDLSSLDVRLCYRMASFSDKTYVKIYTEKSSPNSLNTTLQIPDESYNLLLYKNQPFDRVMYSSVVVQIVPGGYAVFGYSTTQPFFNILVSQPVGRLQTYTSGGITVRVPTQYTNTIAQVPYGYVFTSPTSVADFLLSYGKFLETQGLTFTETENSFILDWSQMVNEFLYWSQQGWDENALINLNPLASKLQITKPGAVVDAIVTQTNENVLLNQNKRELPTRDMNIVRLDNTFTMQPLTDQTISLADLRFTSYEHMIVFDNRSVFGDLIYEPVTGARQSRLNFVGITSTEWNGTVNAQGFILNQNNVQEWSPLKKYSKGEVVKYKNEYWSAAKIVDPTPEFKFDQWLKSDYTQIEVGLLPNISNKADQLQNTYSVYAANLETDTDLLSYGLIGFRPRQYMAALNLDDVSQVNVYSQFLESKGTVRSVELLSNANLGKEAADYNVYENWAVQRAVYGANANRSFVELRLNRSLLSANPSIVQVIESQQTSQADQTIPYTEVWRQSYRLTGPDFLPTTTTTVLDTGLPSAGYVNFDDVDVTTFDLLNPSSLEANLENIEVGSTIWVAKVNNYDWNIYRAVKVPGVITHVCDNLDGTSICNFDEQHGLRVGDQLIIRLFDPSVDGVYQVLTTPSTTSITIAYQFAGSQTVVNGSGIGFTLQTQRVKQASDILNLPYANEIQTGAKVWVDNNSQGRWEVLQKENQFSDVTELAPKTLNGTERYGQSVAQSRGRLAVFVGSPRYGFDTGTTKGGIYVYVKQSTGQYQLTTPSENADSILTLDVDGVRGYGNAVDFGNQTWAAAGASKSLGPANEPNVGYASVIYRDPQLGQPGINPFAQWQLLTPPDMPNVVQPGEFGYSVTVSADERWMYVGEPGKNRVHAYGLVDWQDQFIRVRSDGATVVYNIADTIQINANTQLIVRVDDTVQTLGVDYTVAGDFSSITFATAPAENSLIDISRIGIKEIDGQEYFDIPQASTSGSGVNALFTIKRVRGKITVAGATTPGTGYAVGNTVTIAAASFGGGTSPANDLVLTVTGVNASGGILAVTGFTSWTGPIVDTFSLNEYFFTATNINSFSVYVDTVLQRPNIDYIFNADNSSVVKLDLTFLNSPPAGSSVVVQAKGYYQYVDTMTVAGLAADARFGHSVATTSDGRQVLIGSPYETVDGVVQAGAVYVFDRNVQKFIYTNDSVIDVLGQVTGPVSVIVNNVFLTNQDDGIVGAANTFTVSGNQITINADLKVGDVIEIETNQFAQLQKVTQDTPSTFANFGESLDICGYNCSLYVGAPQDSTQQFKAGSVQRSVNQSRLYGTTASVENPTLTVGDTLRVNNIDVEVPVGGLSAFATAIMSTVPNVTATVVTTDSNERLVLSVKNAAAAAPTNKLQVAPGSVGTAFDDLGFETFAFTQMIYSPYPVDFAGFGYSVNIDDNNLNLVVGAPQGTLYLFTIFDDGDTDFDANSTIFFSTILNSGAVYTFDYLPSAADSVLDPGKFVFGVQVGSNQVRTYDGYGTVVNYTDGVLIAGAPGNDATEDESTAADFGRVFVYDNPSRAAAWTVIRAQQPVVDVSLINGVFTYDRITSARTQFFDFFDPLQGKILGAAKQNIDYIGALDPASYNIGPVNNFGNTWAAEHVGEIWWDVSTVRFIDPNQDNIVYAARRWGQVFPGSQIDVYQWVRSTVPPANYTGPGTPHNVSSYSVTTKLGEDGVFVTYYYFWVRNITTVDRTRGKTLSAFSIAQYIENPKASGIPYIAAIDASTIALYNAVDLIEAQDTIINIEYDREYTDNNVHVEYELIGQDKADAFLSNGLYRKLQDSFCGVDTAGNLVPDPNLNAAERYGVQFRPRQSMFADRFAALKNYIQRANSVLKLYPIVENRTFVLLNSSEPIPASVDPVTSVVNWNLEVANLEILSFQNIYAVPVGYKYLIASDSQQNGLWTIYQVQLADTDPAVRILKLIKVQNYDTRRYWNYIDWYMPGYNSSTKVVAEVPNYSALNTIDVPVGSSVKVTANAQGKFEIYIRNVTNWERVGLQDGTIAISDEIWNYSLGRFGFDVEVFDAQYFDQEPVIETRKIIQAINEELFIDDLLIERNKALTLMFNFVLSEFTAPEWLVKTSLIDVDHRIRSLEPFQNYRQDNQEFVLDYIQEVKPYHVQIREFNLRYSGFDQYIGDATDFDVPAYYDTSLDVPQYVSPILLPYNHGTAQVSNVLSDADATSLIWKRWPYSQWFSNYGMVVDNIIKISGGSGYTSAPTVVVGDEWQPNTVYQAGAQFFNGSDLYTVLTSGQSGDTPPTFAGGIESNGTLSLQWAGFAAKAYATYSAGTGTVSAIIITNPGSGYRITPEIKFIGGGNVNLVPARGYAVLQGRGYGTNLNQGLALPQYYSLARTFKTTIKFDRFQYRSQVYDWEPNVNYLNGTLVRYQDQIYRAESSDGSSAVEGPTFDLADWTLVNPASLDLYYNETQGYYEVVPGTSYVTGVDRTKGIYVAGVNSPGLDLPLLIDGIDYPGVQVFGKDFGSTQMLDAEYSSSFADIYLGTRFTDINIDGGKFIGPAEGHAPEELVNGAEYDTLDMRVYTRPGSDWTGDGHGFQIANRRYTVVVGNDEFSWAGLVENPVSLVVSSVSGEKTLTPDVDYTVNWVDQTVTMITVFPVGTIINIAAYELGGGSQLYRDTFAGDLLNYTIVPVSANEIFDVVIFVNGQQQSVASWEPYTPGSEWNILDNYSRLDVVYTTGPTSYYRALQSVPAGIDIDNTDYWLPFVPATESKVFFDTAYTPVDAITITVFGETVIAAGSFVIGRTYTISVPGTTNFVAVGAVDNLPGTTFVATGAGSGSGTATTVYGWSTPQTQYWVVTPAINTSKVVTLDNSLSGTNIPNMIVQIDGKRLRPYDCIEWIGDDNTVEFGLPTRGGYSQEIIDAATDISVYVDGILQQQTFGAITGDYSVTNWDGTQNRQVVFVEAPAVGAQIVIAVSTVADYLVSGTQLQLVSPPPVGGILSVTTWNDTTQLNALTLTFQGPVSSGVLVQETFDSTDYDPLFIDNGSGKRDPATNALNGDPGSYDYSAGVVISQNNFDLLRTGLTASRLWVTLNGNRLFDGKDFVVEGQYLILGSGTIAPSDILVVTEFTESIVPEAMAFRIFQDMRGVQAVYRITNATTTRLAQSMTADADIAYLVDASVLTEPDLPNGIFGVCTIKGERIMYRVRDLGTNTIQGLMRGTAGTAASDHPVDSYVYDMGRGNLLYEEYQNRVVSDTTGAVGIDPDRTPGQTVFYAPNVDITDFGDSSSIDARSVEVYVGGIRQYAVNDSTAESQYRWFITEWSLTNPPYPPGNGIAVEFDTSVGDVPLDTADVTILVRRSESWYGPGYSVSNGTPLQESETRAARFLRGL